MKPNNKPKDEFLSILIGISSDKKLLDGFFKAILSPREYEEIIHRLQVFKMSFKGFPQRQIASKLKVGLATASRGAREVKEQEKIFKKIFQHAKKTSKNKS